MHSFIVNYKLFLRISFLTIPTFEFSTKEAYSIRENTFLLISVLLYLQNINKKPIIFYGVNDDLRSNSYGNYWIDFYVDEKILGVKARSW